MSLRHSDSEVFPDGQCRLVLIGRTGCGKSSTGNTIIGSEVFRVVSGINSGTKNGRLESTIRDHLEIQVLDTPGLADTDGDDELLSMLILRSLCAMHPGPHAVLLVLRCDHRFTKEAYQVYLALKSIFGENLPKFMILIFVGFDNFQNDSKHFEEELLRSSESLQSLMKEANNRYLLFDNKCKEKRFEQVSRLLVQVKLLIRENNGRCFEHKLMPTIRNVFQRLVKEEESSMSANESNCPHLLNKLGQCNIHDQTPPIETDNVPTQPTEMTTKPPEPTNIKRKPKRPAPSPPINKCVGEDRRAPSPPRDKCFGEDRPDMTFADKQAMVEDILKQKMANEPENLTPVQRNIVDEASKGIYARVKRKMKQFSIKTIDACSLM